MFIDHDEVPSTTRSTLSELDNTMFESEDSNDDKVSTQPSTPSTTTSKKCKRKLKAVNTWLHGRKHHLGEPEQDKKN